MISPRSVLPIATLLWLAAVLGCEGRAAHSAARGAIEAPRGLLELAVIAGERPVRVDVKVLLDGRPIDQTWDTIWPELFAFHDRNDDGVLDVAEAARLPSTFAMRQMARANITPFIGPGPAWERLDANSDGRVVVNELRDFYRASGVGDLLVAVGRNAAAEELTDRLIELVDVDADGHTTSEEWQRASTTVARWDTNGDDLLVPGELLDGVVYPGTTASEPLAPFAAPDPSLGADQLPLFRLPRDKYDASWANAVLAFCDRNNDSQLDASEIGFDSGRFQELDIDGDGELPVPELQGWRNSTADVVWRINLDSVGTSPPGDDNLPDAKRRRHAPRGVHMELWRGDGGTGKLIEQVAQRYRSRFAAADADRDGRLTAAETDQTPPSPELVELSHLRRLADRDGDGLTEAELTSWLDLQGKLASVCATVTLVDHGLGLFAFLDADHDGACSLSEIDTAWSRLQQCHCTVDGALQLSQLPRQIHVIVSQGQPRSLLRPSALKGPTWFQAMDRNRDGEVSAEEFLGEPDEFRPLDANGDGRLSPGEVETSPPR